ncbi:MAG TPA: hypothetical protein VFF27_18000 [Bacteroidia bacterium]|jgi:hypothetical protein|nr:hypothetical protein [Bacteroidia bacterium]
MVRSNLLFILFLLSTAVCQAQTTVGNETTIPVVAETLVKAPAPVEAVTKTSPTQKPLLKIIFDDSNSQLLGIDTTGKIVDNAIIAFQLFVKIKGVDHSEQALGSYLSKAMLDLLAQVEQNTILYFEHIQVKNPAGNLVEVEDFQYTLSYLPKKK